MLSLRRPASPGTPVSRVRADDPPLIQPNDYHQETRSTGARSTLVPVDECLCKPLLRRDLELLPWLQAIWDYLWGLPTDPTSWKKTDLILKLVRLLTYWVRPPEVQELTREKQLYSPGLQRSSEGLWSKDCNILPHPNWPDLFASNVPDQIIRYIPSDQLNFASYSVSQ